MDCTEVRRLLSAYYDEEVSSEQQIAMARHLESCDECSGELAKFERLSVLAGDLDEPTPPLHVWAQLEQQLDEERGKEGEAASRPSRFGQWWLFPMPRLVALAATVLLVVGLGWFGYRSYFGEGDHEGFTIVLGHYLDLFHRDPPAAQQYLLANYDGQLIDAQQAVQRVGYRPAVADGMPAGYALVSTYVMKMPCCTCAQSVCNRSDGSTIAIFEHDDEKATEWFGDRPALSAACNGKQCSLVELNDSVAASWKRENRHITVIGIRDLAEVSQLVAWFDERKQTGPLLQ